MEKIIKIVLPLLAVFGVTFIVASGLTRDPASISGRTAKELQAAGEEAESNRVKLSIAGGETEAAEDAETSGNGSGSSTPSDPADPQADASSAPENSAALNPESAAPAEVSDVEIPSGQVDPVTEILSYSGGTPVQLADEAMAACIREQAGLAEDEPITDTLCQSIIKLNANGYELKNLNDLAYMTNLEWFFYDPHAWLGDHSLNISSLMTSNSALVDALLSDYSLDLTGIEQVPHLKGLSIKGCDITTPLVDSSLQNLKQLEYLALQGTIKNLDFLGNMPNLNTFFLDSDPYMELDISGIETLTNLKILSLRECLLTDISPLGSMTQLEYLDLYTTGSRDIREVSDFSSLAVLKNLKSLSIRVPYDSDCSFLNSLTNLLELKLDCPGIEMQYSLSALSNLRRLTINRYDSEVIRQLDENGALGKLQYLYCKGLDSDALSRLSKAVNLEELYVSLLQDAVSLEALDHMEKLKVLHIDCEERDPSKMSAEEYKRIGNLKNLEELIIDYLPNPIAEAGADGYGFLSSLVNLNYLSICIYDGADIGCFSDLKALESLTLSGEFFQNITVDIGVMNQLSSLKEFYYQNFHFADEGLPESLGIQAHELQDQLTLEYVDPYGV